MATSGAGKARSRRSHARKPYERSGGRKSILSSVTEYLTPSWLKGMWSQEDSGAQPTTERPAVKPAYEPVTQDQNGLLEEEEIAAPPVRVTRAVLTHTQSTSVQGSEDARPRAGYFSQMPLARGSIHAERQSALAASSSSTAYTWEAPPNSAVPPADNDKFSEDSVSTSVSFSNVPQVDQSERRSEATTDETVRENFPGGATRPKSLWSEERETRMAHPQPPARSTRRPAFNYSVFGSPALSDSSSLFGSPITESPFYEGRTSYGGASAQKQGQKRGRTVSPFQVQPHTMRQQVQARPVNSSRGTGVMSVTAQRILHTLERMSTPITDAKRIPSLTLNTEESPLGFTPSSKKRRITGGSFLDPGSTRLDSRLAGQPPVQRLNLATPASIATNRAQTHSAYRHRKSALQTKEELLPEREPSAPEDTEPSPVKAISQPTSKPSESQPTTVSKPTSQSGATWTPPAQLPAASGGKMRRERSYGTQRAHAVQDDDVAEVPNLPQIALPLSGASLPKFDFSPAPVQSKPVSAGPKVSTASTSPQASRVTTSPQFTFASPIVRSSPEDAPSPTGSPETPSFQFSLPASPGSGKPIPSQGSSTSSGISASTGSSMTFLTSGAGTTFQPKRKSIEPAVSVVPTPSLRQGSVLDALKDTPLPLKSGSVLDALKAEPKGSKAETLQTVKEKPAEGKTAAGLPSLWEQFKKPAGTWDCDTCMVQNTAAASRCVACDTPKPGSQPKLTVPSTGPSVVSVTSNSNEGKDSPAKAGSLFMSGTGAGTQSNGFKFGSTTEGGSANSGFKFQPASDKTSTSTGFQFGSSSASAATSKQGSVTFGTKDSATTSSSTQDASKSISSSSAGGNKWTSGASLVENQTEDKTKCEIPKLGSQDTSSSVSVTNGNKGFTQGTNSSGLAALISAQQSKWECETCLVQNDKDVTKCVACETPKPGSAQPTSGTSGFQVDSKSVSAGKAASFGGSVGGFQFGAPKTNSTETSADSKSQFSGFKFGSGGTEPATSTPSTGGFQFGTGSAPASTTSSGGFTFGAGGSSAGAVSTTPPSSEGFTFSTGTTSAAASSGGFTFGTAGTAAAPATAAGFTFGAGTASQQTTSFGGTTAAAPTFTSIADAAKAGDLTVPKPAASQKRSLESDSNSQVKAPSFGSGASTQVFGSASASTTPSFGSTTSTKPPVFGTGTSATPSTGLTFGTAAPPAASGSTAATTSGFTFGTGSSAASTTAAPFSFGATAPLAVTTASTSGAFVFGAGTSSTPGGSSGGFNFSAGQATGPATTATPSFGATAFGATPGLTTTSVSGGSTPFGGATGFGVQTTSAGGSGAVFGSTAAQPAAPAGFSFNAPSQPSFQFGAGSQQSPAVFNFGAGGASAGGAPGAPGGEFNFTAGSGTTAPQPSAPFNFNAGAQAGGNPFSIQGTPSSSSARRVIKRAARRKK